MDVWFPDVRVQKLSPRMISNAARFISPFTSATRTVARGGDRWGFKIDLNELKDLDRARMEATISALRGAANRVIFTPADFVQRGSFPSGELFTNYNFTNGLTAWSSEASVSIATIDRGIRATRTVFDGTQATLGGPTQAVTLAQYVPYLIRFFAQPGRSPASWAGPVVENGVAADGLTGTGVFIGTAQASTFGPLDVVRVPLTAGSYTFGPYFNYTSGGLAGDYFDVLMASCSRCAIVDNGPNALLNSDDFSTGWTTSAASIATNALTDPYGGSAADVLSESNTAAEHYVQQGVSLSSAAVEYVGACAIKANGRNFAGISLIESTGATIARGDFNVNTGALGGVATGANWTNVRQFIVPLGNGWFYCAVVARKTSAGTTVTMKIQPEAPIGTVSYTGSNSVALGLFRATLAQGSFPTRLSPTAGASLPNGTLQTGSAIYVKGLPASTNGLLLPGDWFELNKEMKRVTNALNSDAAGMGYLQFSPPIRTPPAEQDPVIINAPAGRFIMAADENGWETVPGLRSTYALDLIEAN